MTHNRPSMCNRREGTISCSTVVYLFSNICIIWWLYWSLNIQTSHSHFKPFQIDYYCPCLNFVNMLTFCVWELWDPQTDKRTRCTNALACMYKCAHSIFFFTPLLNPSVHNLCLIELTMETSEPEPIRGGLRLRQSLAQNTGKGAGDEDK